MAKLRCSKLPLFMSCANSVVNPDNLTEVETKNSAAETGTIIHALAEDLIRNGHCDLRHHEIRLKEIEGLERALELLPKIERIWRLARPVFIEPILEEYLEAEIALGISITGHIDIHEAFDTHAFILDWKTGRQRTDHYHQIMGYAFLVWEKLERPDNYEIYMTVAYVENGEYGLEKMPMITPRDLTEWAQAVSHQVQDTRYVTSEKCLHCPLGATCPAHYQKKTTAVQVIREGVGGDLRTTDDPADVVNRLKIIKDAVKRFESDVKADVIANGPIDLGDGTYYRIEEKPQEVLDTRRAFPLLEDHGLSSSDVLKATKLSLPSLRKAVYTRAVKGDKSLAVDRFNEALQQGKALFSSVTNQLWRRPKK